MMTGGSSTESCAEAAADKPSMKTVAKGVRVTDACVLAIRLITQTGRSAGDKKAAQLCASESVAATTAATEELATAREIEAQSLTR